MHIWVDADACPKVIKEILYRVAERTKILTIFVSNQPINTMTSPFIQRKLVPAGFDMADNQILQSMQMGDLVITADIPLANGVIDKGGTALNPRGEMYTKSNIKQRLTIRNFNEELRGSGMITSGPAKLHQREVQAFANALDRFLARR